MRIFVFMPVKHLTIFAVFVLTGMTQVIASNNANNIAFSDPEQLANVDDDFLKKEINYNKNVSDVDVVINLGQQTYPALHKIVEKIAKDNGLKVNVQRGSCGTTAHKLLKKTIDIGTYCCPPGQSDRLPGLQFHTIAIAPLVLVTNTANPVNNVSSLDAKKIFKGDYVYWSEVPATEKISDQLTGKKIQPVVRLHCKKRPGHWRLLLKDADAFSPMIQDVSVIPDVIKNVAENTNAISYETPFMLKVHKDKGELKVLNIDGVNPDDLQRLIIGDYPIYRTYSMTTWSNPENYNSNAEALLKYIIEYIESHGDEQGFIPASKLRQAGWVFKDDELIGAPDGMPIISEHK